MARQEATRRSVKPNQQGSKKGPVNGPERAPLLIGMRTPRSFRGCFTQALPQRPHHQPVGRGLIKALFPPSASPFIDSDPGPGAYDVTKSWIKEPTRPTSAFASHSVLVSSDTRARHKELDYESLVSSYKQLPESPKSPKHATPIRERSASSPSLERGAAASPPSPVSASAVQSTSHDLSDFTSLEDKHTWHGRLLQSTRTGPLTGPEALLATVESGAIAPLRGSYLVSLHQAGGRLQRRQALPEEAFFQPTALRSLCTGLGDDFGVAFVAISASWLQSTHLDPCGFHLAILAAAASLYLKAPQVPPRTPLHPIANL